MVAFMECIVAHSFRHPPRPDASRTTEWAFLAAKNGFAGVMNVDRGCGKCGLVFQRRGRMPGASVQANPIPTQARF
jgi:hypothetical protein